MCYVVSLRDVCVRERRMDSLWARLQLIAMEYPGPSFLVGARNKRNYMVVYPSKIVLKCQNSLRSETLRHAQVKKMLQHNLYKFHGN